MRRCAVLAGCLGLLAGVPQGARAQRDTEPEFDQLVAAFQRDYLTLGILLQVVGDFQTERTFAGENGFTIANARVRVTGQLDNGFGYLVQANVAASPAILDAAARYRLSAAATVQAGLFKAPFSREFLTGAGSIDFVNRSQVVTALAPNRQIGVQVAGRPGTGLVEYAVGAFNGNRYSAGGNDNDELLYAARLGLWPSVATGDRPNDRLEVALNVAHSRDASAPIGAGFIPSFAGTRTVYGGDVRWRRGRWLAAGEFIAARLDFDPGPVLRPTGWHATAGYMLTRKSQVLARWDALRPDGIGPDQDLLVLGYNLWPTRPTELQVNYVIPIKGPGPDRHQLLVNLQVGF